jgi:uncharacterized repeat protein (TIGR03803 family)
MMINSTHSAARILGDARRSFRAPSRLQMAGRGIAWPFLFLALLAFGATTLSAQSYKDLYDFAGTPDGCCPQHPSLMAQGRDNDVYGVTATGGKNNKGMIFKIPPAGGLVILYNFDGTHGSTPVGGLTLGPDGDLYGMAEEGGANGFGNIFKITPAGDLTVLYDFTGNADGGLPVSPLIVGADGNFYGTSYPGAAFMMTPQGVVHVITKIPTSSFGQLLQTIDGSFYGVTEFGGTKSAGTIYKISGNTSTIIHSFDGTNGSFPIGGLVEGADGNLYGTTTAEEPGMPELSTALLLLVCLLWWSTSITCIRKADTKPTRD